MGFFITMKHQQKWDFVVIFFPTTKQASKSSLRFRNKPFLGVPPSPLPHGEKN